jgi:hypothetical protein
MSSELPLEAPSLGSTAISDQFTESSWTCWSDWAGMVASIGCAIHCAAMPFAIAYLPALGLSFLADQAFHKWMVAGCFAIALAAFIPGVRKHGRLTPKYVGERLSELENVNHAKTCELTRLYGSEHLERTIAWFRRASDEMSSKPGGRRNA